MGAKTILKKLFFQKKNPEIFLPKNFFSTKNFKKLLRWHAHQNFNQKSDQTFIG